ncbi:MAG: MazG family protein [Nostocoides sp.]
MTGRVTLLLTSPRVAPGLLSRAAWRAVETTRVLAAAQNPTAAVLVEAGINVETLQASDPADVAAALVQAGSTALVLWLTGTDGDPGLTDAIAIDVTRRKDPPEVEILPGSWDVPGARLLDVVAVMDRLRSPGGCPWDAEQTHDSLMPYLAEETAEYAEAVASGDRAHMAEELGDVLLQVAFHARVAQEHLSAPFDIDDVAAGLVEKLVRRHPHVFGDAQASTPEEVEANWAAIKAQEKATGTVRPRPSA